LKTVIIIGAAFLAGAVNSVAGGGSLISFPALLWIGRDPVIANATNTLAMWPGSLAGAVGYRGQFSGSRQWLLMLAIPSVLGGLIGAWVLLVTPKQLFGTLAPYLILSATLLLAGQRWILKILPKRSGSENNKRWWAGAIAFQFLVAVYGGYFGAGIGILMLAALGLLGLTDIQKMNALKTILAMLINAVAAVYFVIAGVVNWRDALVMAAAAMVGGYAGAGLALKAGQRVVRATVIAIGLAMTLSLLFFKH
jgi:uncharacterized membrane protein YfcA